MSRFSTIEASAYSVLKGVAAVGQTKLVAAGMLLRTRFESYPGAMLALDNSEALPPSMPPSFDSASYKFRCQVAILLLASSDGVTVGDARWSAWQITDAVVDAFSVPPWVPKFTDGTTVFPSTIGSVANVLTEVGQAGIYIPVNVEIEWRT